MPMGLVLALLLASAAPGEAPDADATNRPVWTRTLAVATDFPFDIGATIRVESSLHRIHGAFTMGVLPTGYLNTIADAAVNSGAFDASTGELVKSSLRESLVLRFGGGWRPFPRRGFYGELDYTIVTLGGDVAEQDLLALVTGSPAPSGADSGRNYDVQSTLALFGGEVGWEWQIPRRPVRLRIAAGYSRTIAASTTVTPRFQPLLPGLVKVFTDACEAYLDEVYLTYVHSPTLSASLGWTF